MRKVSLLFIVPPVCPPRLGGIFHSKPSVQMSIGHFSDVSDHADDVRSSGQTRRAPKHAELPILT